MRPIDIARRKVGCQTASFAVEIWPHGFDSAAKVAAENGGPSFASADSLTVFQRSNPAKISVIGFRHLSAFIAAASLGFGFESLSAAETVVRLRDGQMIRGEVLQANETDNAVILEVQAAGIRIRRVLLRSQIDEARPPLPNKLPRATNEPVTRPVRQLDNAALASRVATFATPPSSITPAEHSLYQLLVRADPISTFGRMDWDSLRLTLQGIDQLGDPVSLHGTLRITLWGLRDRPDRLEQQPDGQLRGSSRRSLEQLESWTRQVDSSLVRLADRALPVGASQGRGTREISEIDMLPNYEQLAKFQNFQRSNPPFVSMLLPLTRSLPDHDPQLVSAGEVTVELLIPGVGVFAAAAPNVALNHVGPLRQWLCEQEGTRFFPNERTTDSRQFIRDQSPPLRIRLQAPPFPIPIGQGQLVNPAPVPLPLPVIIPTPVPVISPPAAPGAPPPAIPPTPVNIVPTP